ncbi:MAG TPA: hypothetical protein VGH45_11655 [Solirubrobacteraceae bacterium]
MRGLLAYLRANPQVAVLAFICLVLGLGTFIVVLISLASSGNTTPSGAPSGVISAAQILVGRS